MKRFHFVFETLHPDDGRIRLRFVVETPYVSAEGIAPGSTLEAHVVWVDEPVSKGTFDA